MQPAPAFSLTLFGTPRFTEAGGSPVTGRAAQRHRIGVLALLACAYPRGCAREAVMASLWPEHDTESARKLLNQAVYVLRKTLGEDAIFSDLEELRLDGALLRVDVAEFQLALERGDGEAAVALYRGPFLDGFFINGAPEFGEWVERERNRLAGLHARALEQLAENAEAAGDFGLAVERWKARVAHDRYDTPATLRLMAALDAGGHRAAALQHARTHEHLLREEFGIEPPAELRAFAERLRAAAVPAASHTAGTEAGSADAAGVGGAEAAPDVDVSVPRFGRRHLRRAAAAAVLAVLVFGGLRVRGSGSAPASAPSLAVLPLENLGGDPAGGGLAEGMADEVVTKLAELPGLRVVGSSAVRPLLQRGIDARSAADSLHVDYVLEGGFQKIGEQLRIRLRLVQVRDGTTRWSHTYDGMMQDGFALHDEVALSVARELGLQFAGGDMPRRSAGTRNVAAYEHYLRGSDRTLLRSDSGALAGLEHFQRAVAEDSSYAAAWAGLARMYARTTSALPVGERADHFRRARQAAQRAVLLDDSLAEAHATLGVLLMRAFDIRAAERHLTRAVALDPTRALTHEWLVRVHLWAERPRQALAHAQRALELEPLSPTAHAELARALAGNGRCAEALEQLRKLEGVRPPLLRTIGIAAVCHAHLGQWDSAVASIRRASADPADPHLGLYLARAGMTAEAERVRTVILEKWSRGEASAFDVALQYVGAGTLDESFLWLNRALDDDSLNGSLGNDALLLFGAVFAPVRADPRFAALRSRIHQKR